ncbi:MAG TPA: NYN domain-containing protein [Iamia sp.]
MGSPPRTARTDLLREVLDVAIAVGRRVEAEGRGPVPAPLRPVLSLTRIGARARAAADRAGDDDAFRALVAEAVAVEDLDEAGQLWLTRPEGWEDALDALVRRRIEADADADARRALDRERRARRRAEDERDRLRADLDRAQAELAELADLRTQLTEAEVRAETLADERAAAIRQLKDLETLHQRAHDDLRTVRAELDQARADAQTPAPAEPVIRSDGKPSDPITGSQNTEAADAVETAAGAAAELARALDALASSLRPPAEPRPAATPPRPRHPERSRRPRRRRPPLPGGVHDDSPEAAAHLVRLPGCALLVDGYNATMATWPDRDLPEQRRRLVDALDQLEARVGVQATVVFDGVEEAWKRSTSRRVDVRFTPAGVEADDVILDLVDALPGDRPVVVASDDQRVRAGARQRGAHPIGTAQLRSLLV